VLVITLVLGGILGITLSSYLLWVRSQNLMVAESQAWNDAMAIAEAGIEEGMAQVNVFAGGYTTTNYLFSMQNNNWPRTNALIGGYYSANIFPDIPGPTIISTGYTTVPYFGKQIVRTVEVTTSIKPLLANTITALSNVTSVGSGLVVDSYDSSDLVRFPGGIYNSANRMAGGDVASLYGLIQVQNATIYGHLETGPNAPDPTINNGQVGDLTWSGHGIEPGWWLNDFNMDVPDIQPPYGSIGTTTPTVSGNTYNLGNGHFYVSGDFTLKNNETLYVSGDATLYVTGNFTMNNNAIITNATSTSLKLYIGSPTGPAVAASLGMVNTSGIDSTFQVYGLPTLKQMTWGGNTAFLGVVYAPEASLKLGGGGSSSYDFQGALTCQSLTLNGHFNIHYDQNLKRLGPSSGYTVTSWKEL